jgi:hypothetical protein
MTELVWNESANRKYTHGLDKGVLFVRDAVGDYGTGVPWDGLISVSEDPEGAEPTDLWANNIKYATLMSAEKLKGTIEAYWSPKEFDACDGAADLDAAGGVSVSLQPRSGFGIAYRTMIGSDAGGTQVGYQIHLIYGCTCSPSQRSRSTANDSPEATQLSWEFESNPAEVGGTFNPTSKVTVDSMLATSAFMTWLEETLWGTVAEDSAFPLPSEIKTQAETLV